MCCEQIIEPPIYIDAVIACVIDQCYGQRQMVILSEFYNFLFYSNHRDYASSQDGYFLWNINSVNTVHVYLCVIT